jgi:hypothetical protein
MMNERLQELADQAQKYVYEMFDGNIDRNTERFKVKFAELIVNECFRAAMIESKGHMNPGELIKRMKERVGVE